MTPHVNSQHTVPQCYLKNFSEDGTTIFRKFKKVVQSDKLNFELSKSVSLKSTTTKDNFYTVNRGSDPMLVETLIYSREIENYYPRYYKMLVNPNIKCLPTMKDRSRLLMCLLSLHCRTPKQFELYFDLVPEEFHHELEQIKEDYKADHLRETLASFIGAHQFKIFRIAKIIDTAEFITSDNPVLLIGATRELTNSNFSEQFNSSNRIVIPIDRKHCCILTDAKDKNGISINGKLFYNKIDRFDVDFTFAQNVNSFILESADEYYYGAEKYMKAYFSFLNEAK